MWGNYATTPEPADPTLRRILQQADVSSLSTQYANGMEWRIAAQDILHRNGLSSDTHCHYSITVCVCRQVLDLYTMRRRRHRR